MTDFIAAIGLVFVIEGLIWALSPGLVVRLLFAAARTPEAQRRTAGAVAVALGVIIVWMARSSGA
jgi:uncharacterized protein YjeT (DUF2065 family)